MSDMEKITKIIGITAFKIFLLGQLPSLGRTAYKRMYG